MAHAAAAYGLKLHAIIIGTLAPRHGWAIADVIGESRRMGALLRQTHTTNPQAQKNPPDLRLSASAPSMKTERGVNNICDKLFSQLSVVSQAELLLKFKLT